MRKTIKATNFVLTEAISDYLDKRLSVLDRYVDVNNDSVTLDIEIGKSTNRHKSGDIFRAEANFHMKNIDVRVEPEAGDLYSAIDLMKDELVEAIRTKKHKKLDIIRRGGIKLKNFLKGFRNEN